ncbi:hypothetical protein F5888DRAFT_1892895 [Russula emetica]|nr:hypothetical protein F5888DRAFT_1892895 [Russula emetica]
MTRIYFTTFILALLLSHISHATPACGDVASPEELYDPTYADDQHVLPPKPPVKPPVITPKPPVITPKPPVITPKPPVTTTKPPSSKPPVTTPKPPSSKPPTTTPKPPSSKPPTTTPKPPSSKPPTTTPKPPSSKPPTTTPKPPSSKPPTTTPKPPSSKPPTTTPKPPSSKPPTTTPKPKPSAYTVAWSRKYDKKDGDTSKVTCSKLDKKFPHFVDFPSFPYIGAAKNGKDYCGTCWSLTDVKTGQTITVTIIDTTNLIIDTATITVDYVISQEAFEKLNDGKGNTLKAEAKLVSDKPCPKE